MTQEGDDTRAKILRLCAKEFKTTPELAEALGKSVNTVRAHYVYRMVAGGLLVTRFPAGTRNKQGYKKA